MARITNEGLFKKSTCVCFTDDPTKEHIPASKLYCYSEGAIGMLSDKQDSMCRDMIVLESSPELKFHLEKFTKAGKDVVGPCMKMNDEREFYACMEHQASLKGGKYVSRKLKPEPEVRPKEKSKPEPEKEKYETKTTVVGSAKFKGGKLISPGIKPKEKKK